jgi:non-heme chloroperoxidase
MSTAGSSEMTIAEHELQQCEQANASGRPPVVFVHGLWLLPSSWDRWAALFHENGFVALTPGWPDDPEMVEEARAHPEHALTIDSGWREVADTALAFIKRNTQ